MTHVTPSTDFAEPNAVQDPFQALIARLRRQNFAEAARHFEQAKSALDRSEWEAANSQIRAALESLFNEIARLRLTSNKTGGEARKALETEGYLRAREARFIQEFIAVAGTAGSHAGVSNADESLGRFLAGVGIGFLGLGLVPELVRVEDVLIGEIEPPHGARLPTDQEMHTSCPTCGTQQTLAQALITRSGSDTTYVCVNGCQTIVVVGSPEETAMEGRGYRLGPHIIRNARDLILPIAGASDVVIPASKAALIKRAAK